MNEEEDIKSILLKEKRKKEPLPEQPSSASIAWLQDRYEFEGPESESHAPVKAKLGAATDILWLIAKA